MAMFKKTTLILLAAVLLLHSADIFKDHSQLKISAFENTVISTGRVDNFISNFTGNFINNYDYHTFTIGRNDLSAPSMTWRQNNYSNNHYLYQGMLWFGYNGDIIRLTRYNGSDFSVQPGNPEIVRFTLNDSGRVGVWAECRVIGFENADYLVYEYRLVNQSGQNLTDLYAGLYMDVDASSLEGSEYWRDDFADYYINTGFDSIRESISYIYDANNINIPGDDTGGILFPKESNGYLGSRVLFSPATKKGTSANVQSGHMITQPQFGVNMGSHVYELMQAENFNGRPQNPADARFMQTLGPWDLQNGDTLLLAFSLALGSGFEAMRTAMKESYRDYWQVYHPEKKMQFSAIIPSREFEQLFDGDSLEFSVNAGDESGSPVYYNWWVNGYLQESHSADFVFNADTSLQGYNIIRVTASNGILSVDNEWVVLVLKRAKNMLAQNFPNPFNAGTSIPVEVWKAGKVRIELIDIIGRRLAVLIDEPFEKGRYLVLWDGRGPRGNPLSSGLYFYKLIFENRTEIRKLTIVR